MVTNSNVKLTDAGFLDDLAVRLLTAKLLGSIHVLVDVGERKRLYGLSRISTVASAKIAGMAITRAERLIKEARSKLEE